MGNQPDWCSLRLLPSEPDRVCDPNRLTTRNEYIKKKKYNEHI